MSDMNKAAEQYRNATQLQRQQYSFLKSLMLKFIYDGKFIDPEVVKPALPVMDVIEDCMQEVLGLPVDRKKHRYTLELPGCTCPRLDNWERFGTGEYIHTEDCPWHGVQHGVKHGVKHGVQHGSASGGKDEE